MKRYAFFGILLMYTLTSFSAKKEITNNGFTFEPANLTIESGDNVAFLLEDIHNVIEVSQATWNANGNTALPGGFSLPFGGGELAPAQLPVGTHYYVCAPHAEFGMKGIIIVGTPTGIDDNSLGIDISIFPNPVVDIMTIKAGINLLGNRYFITDQNGRQMLTSKLDSETEIINISQFNYGIYFLQVEGLKGRSVKLIKK